MARLQRGGIPQGTLSRGASCSLHYGEVLCGYARNQASALMWQVLLLNQEKATYPELDLLVFDPEAILM